MHPLLPSRCHWGRTSEWWVCVCVCMEEVNFTDLSEELESLPSGLSSNWSSDLHLSVGAANRPFLWYHFAFATIGMFMCRCVDLWSSLISGKNPHNQAEVRIWPVDWDFGLSASQMISKIDALSCSKMPLLLSCLPLCCSPPGLRRCWWSFTSECFFYSVERNEMRAGFHCQRCTSWLTIQSVRRASMKSRLFGKVWTRAFRFLE